MYLQLVWTVYRESKASVSGLDPKTVHMDR
jgi:hypothetical protein